MANYVLKELSEEMSGGKKVLYPKMQTYSLQDYKSVLKKMGSYSGSFSEGVMMGVFDALITTMEKWMPEGHSIKIDGLGVFSLTLGFDEETPSEQLAAQNGNEAAGPKEKYRHVCIKGINFRPDQELIQRMNRCADFERSEREVKVPKKSPYPLEQRLEKAREIIRQKGQMTLTDYAQATGLERSVASRELKRLVADPESGITARGGHSHKVWVMKG